MNKMTKFLYRFTAILSLSSLLILTSIPFHAVSALANSSASPDSSNEDFQWPTGPNVFADAAIVMEASTGLILYEKDINTKYYPASITKIMTALLALENCSMSEVMTMSHEAEWDVDRDSSRIGLVEGEQLILKDALYGVMLESANEVAYGVGEHVAKDPITEFSEMMNKRAAELGCLNTNFVNPHGLHDSNHYTTAYDMALISRAAINIPEFKTISGTRTYLIPPTNKNKERWCANHHRFIRQTLKYDWAIGGKTGGTEEALTTLVTFAEHDGLLLIAVVLHVDTALHAYEDTVKMLDFAFENYAVYSIGQTETTEKTSFQDLFLRSPKFGNSEQELLRTSQNANVVLPISANFLDAEKSVKFTPIDELVHGDNTIGQILYTYKGKFVGSADILFYNKDYPLTKDEFYSKWPKYLIPPDIVLEQLAEKELEVTPSGSSNEPSDETDLDDEKQAKSGFKSIFPIIVGVAVGLIIVIAGLYIIFIEIPHRKRKRIYREHHRKRMASMQNSYKDDFKN